MGTDNHNGRHNERYMPIMLLELRRLLDLSDFYAVITVGEKKNINFSCKKLVLVNSIS